MSTRPLWLFATLWSLRKYPTAGREWSWQKKFAAIREGGYDGVFSPPIPAVAERGDLRYLAVTSLGVDSDPEKPFRDAKDLGAVAMDVQICDFDTPVADAVKVVRRIREAARGVGLPFAIETHRDTFTETPEKTADLARGYREATGEVMPLCLDHSHFAVVRHLKPADYWPYLSQPPELLEAAVQFHLRPFTGHHCQIPVLTHAGKRTFEYKDWLGYAEPLLKYLKAQATTDPVLAVPEIGHDAPPYGLSCFPDTWKDVLAVEKDLRRIWKEA